MKKILYIAATLCLTTFSMKADEGMWMIDGFSSKARQATVAIDFFGTGSIISPDGLVITNHHVAYSDICAISSPERNYLKDGFWAYEACQEKPVPGRKMFLLKEFKDVSAEVRHFRDSLKENGQNVGSRRLAYLIEKKYKESTGLEASLNSMWAEEKFYLSLYEVYGDVRLVAAPPESIGSFGGDTDNWQWPQHKCDFALYRIYVSPEGKPAEYNEKNVPLKAEHYLKISTKGYKNGDRTTVIGYPGRTDRYSSSFKTDYKQNLILPINNAARAEQLAIIKKWMTEDESVKLKYSEAFFGLSNVTRCEEGELLCLKKYDIIGRKQALEQKLLQWIEFDAQRKAQWGTLLDDMDSIYRKTSRVERNKAWFRETMFRGPIIWRTIMRVSNSKNLDKALGQIDKGFSQTDPRVEKELLRVAVRQFYTHVEQSFWGPFQKELAQKFGADHTALADYLWQNSIFSSPEATGKISSMEQILSDPLLRFQSDVKITVFNEAENNLELRNKLIMLGREYTRALYAMREDMGIKQYPDANSTLRYSQGKVCDLEPCDGITYSDRTYGRGIMEKHMTGLSDYAIPDDFARIISGYALPVDFLTDNDITGGNSGSPVLNRKGELLGLAFDGNKESLDSEMSYTEEYNRCVCVDIRYVLWLLKHYARFDRINAELGNR